VILFILNFPDDAVLATSNYINNLELLEYVVFQLELFLDIVTVALFEHEIIIL
jgi:hypothetical protein